MIRIVNGRGTGKSSSLMLCAKENNAIIVCHNPYGMRQKAYYYGITGIEFISYFEYISNKDKYDQRKIYIDELEEFVKYFDENFDGYTLTRE